ncbi:MAG: serine hydrolase domain-containing protein [Balneolaceae bacterium]|nr:serine hydrolase domain-containing protein [Balneolaceae bacterium]
MAFRNSYQGLLFSLLFIIPQFCGAQAVQAEKFKFTVDSLASRNLFSGSILVGIDSSVVFYHSAGFSSRNPRQPINRNTTFEIASLTKQFTAALILKLFEERVLSLHEPMGKYLKWYPRNYKDSITIHQLLTHQSGIPNYTDLTEWPSLSTQQFGKKTFVKQLFAGKPLQFIPGSDFSYSNSNYYLLGLIAEEITKKPYGTLLKEYFFTPLKMSNSGVLAGKDHAEIKLAIGYERLPNGFIEKAPHQHYSTAFAVSGLYSTPENLFTWSNALSHNKILPDLIQSMMMTPHSNNYGYGLVISYANSGEIATVIRNPFSKAADKTGKKLRLVWHWGSNPGYNSLFLKIPEKQITLIILENLTQLDSKPPTLIPDLAEKIIPVFLN